MSWSEKKPKRKSLDDYLREKVYSPEEVSRLIKKLEIEAKVSDLLKEAE